MQEFVRIDQTKDYTHDKGEASPRGVVHDDWRGKLVQNAACLKLAAPSGQYILYPPAIPSVGECDKESVGLPEDIHWRSVKLA
ncbi:MAG: hypothetical protein WAK89_04220 [Candidatus Sulfotelmatobacter sp.]